MDLAKKMTAVLLILKSGRQFLNTAFTFDNGMLMRENFFTQRGHFIQAVKHLVFGYILEEVFYILKLIPKRSVIGFYLKLKFVDLLMETI